MKSELLKHFLKLALDGVIHAFHSKRNKEAAIKQRQDEILHDLKQADDKHTLEVAKNDLEIANTVRGMSDDALDGMLSDNGGNKTPKSGH